MNNNAWFKKENPLLSLHSMGGGAAGTLMQGATTKTYIDDVFSTYLYKGDDANNHHIQNGVDLTEGGLVWIKDRDGAYNHTLVDSEYSMNAGGNYLSSSLDGAGSSGPVINSFETNGFKLHSNWYANWSTQNYSSWTFRKAPGFFDVVKYTGTGSTQTLSHSLGSVPGCIMVKRTDNTADWGVYHRGQNNGVDPEDYRLRLNSSTTENNDTYWGDTAPTATQFTVGDAHTEVNASGGTYLAYIFAGGASTAATARSVVFDSTFPGDDLKIDSSSDFEYGTGDFTWEAYVKPTDLSSSNRYVLNHWNSGIGIIGGIYIHQSNQCLAYENASGSGDTILGNRKIYTGQWTHVAVSRNSGITRLFQNGLLIGTGTHDDYSFPASNFFVGTNYGATSNGFDGNISNVRIIKGTGLYTSSFKPPTEPLTNVTNTKLLCCNNSSVTGSTVSPGTIAPANNTPTASTESPFDDTEGFKFGGDSDNLEGIIKCGSYTGNGSTTGPEIHLGWEPSWVLIKDTSASVNWRLHDSMREIVTGGNDPELEPNTSDAESDSDRLSLTPTGFKLTTSSASHNDPGDVYVYMAIRRPDGYVGKPAEAGTSVFAMDYGNNVSGTMSNFVSGFPVDFALMKKPASSSDWYSGSRLTGMGYLKPAADSTEGQLGAFKWQSNVGWNNVNYDTVWLSWMWKRGPGLDVVTFKGNGSAREIPHSLNQVPEMIWTKNRTTDYEWNHYHKGLNGGTNPEQYYIQFTDGAEVQNSGRWNDQAPTATAFSIGTHASVNANNANIIAMLFSSVAGISKVGYYSGSTSQQTITLGFQPRFIIIRNTAGSRNWVVFDTERGWASGNDEELNLNKTDAQGGNNDFGAPTATGFTLNYFGNDDTNNSGFTYIYYAHA